MISVVLSILKFILLILACILGLLLLILSLILFVPIRYELHGESNEQISAKIRVSWLLRILSIKISYIEEELTMKFRIFGIPFDRFTRKNSNKDDKKSRKRKNNKHNKKPRKDSDNIELVSSYKIKEEQEEKDSINIDLSEDENIKKRTIEHDDAEHKEIKEPKKQVKSYINKGTKESTKEKQSIFSKILENIKHLKTIILKIFDTIKSILIKIYNFLLNIDSDEKESNNKFKIIKEFIKENKLGIKRVIKAIKELLKHIMPRKIKGYVEFGTGDPSSTGQALGIISVFYGLYYDNIRLVPNFEEKTLKGNVFLQGRIRLSTIAIIMLKLLIDRDFRILWKNYNVLKEEL